MKKLLSLLLIVFLGLSFAGCNSSTSSLTYNLENNISKLTTILNKTKEVEESEILLPEFSTNNLTNVSAPVYKRESANNITENGEEFSAETQEIKTNRAKAKQIRTTTKSDIKASSSIKIGTPSLTNKAPKTSSSIRISSPTTAKRNIKASSSIKIGSPSLTQNGNSTMEAKPQNSAINNPNKSLRPINNQKPRISDNVNSNNNNKLLSNQTKNYNARINRLTNGTYTPRRVKTIDYNNATLTNYLSKIEDLYLMMNDASCANNDACILKNNILETCNLLSMLCKQLKSKKITLSENQLESCNDMLIDLNKNTKELSDSKNDVANQASSVKKINATSSANVEQISSNYLRLINCLDTRICYYENILSILNQLRYTITGVCENCPDLKIEEENKSTIPEKNALPMPKITDEDKEITTIEPLENDNSKNLKTKLDDIINKPKDEQNIDNKNTNQSRDLTKDTKDATVSDTQTVKKNISDETVVPEVLQDTKTRTKYQNNSSKNNKSNSITIKKSPRTGIYDNKKSSPYNNDYEVNKNDETILKSNKRTNTKKDTLLTTNNSKLPNSNIDTFGYRPRTTNNNNNNNNTSKQRINENSTQNYNSKESNNANKFNNNNSTKGNANKFNNNNSLNGNASKFNNSNSLNGNGNGGIINNGMNGNGVGFGNTISNGYGIHNYENGITNPYRNTDTYKLPTGNQIANGYGTGYGGAGYGVNYNIAPLKSEQRKNFQAFQVA